MNLNPKPEDSIKNKKDTQEEPFAIVEDFEETEKRSITERIKRELLDKEKENPELRRIKKLAQESQIGLTEKIQKKIEESLEEIPDKNETSEKYIQKTREQLKAMSEQAKTGLTAKIKKILEYQRGRTVSKVNQEWERLKRMAKEAQISVTAKIHSTFLDKTVDSENGEEISNFSFFSCLFFLLGIVFSGLFVAFLIERWLGGN